MCKKTTNTLKCFYVFGCYYVIMASSLWNMEIIFCLHPEELNGLRFDLVWLIFMFDRFVLVTWESCSQVNIRGVFLRGKKKIPCMFLNALPLFSSTCLTEIWTWMPVKCVLLSKTKINNKEDISLCVYVGFVLGSALK